MTRSREYQLADPSVLEGDSEQRAFSLQYQDQIRPSGNPSVNYDTKDGTADGNDYQPAVE